MTAFYASRKPPGTIGARKRMVPYRKVDHTAKAQPPSRATMSSRQQRELDDMLHAMAAQLRAKLKGPR